MDGNNMAFVGGVGHTVVDLIYTDIPHLPATGEEVFSRDFGMYLGGGVPAIMINTTRLGIPSRVLTFIGEDFFSRFAASSFEKYGVEFINLYKGSGIPVEITSVMVCNEDRSFVSYMDWQKLRSYSEDDVYNSLTGAKIVDMNVGFLDVYRQLKKEGTILIFDTGWEDDLSISKYKDYLELADYYLPNRKEALKITDTQSVEQAAEILSNWFGNVVIKLDKDGCLLKNRKGIQYISPLPGIKAVDATGCGDAFMSGFIYGLFYGHPVEQCICFGNVTGGICAQSAGCLTSYVDEKKLLKLVLSVKFHSKNKEI